MNPTRAYIAAAIVILGALAALVLTGRGRGGAGGRLTPLAGLAFAFILAGFVFGDARAVGYPLLGVGVLLAVVDIVNRTRRR